MTNNIKLKHYISKHRWLVLVLCVFLFHTGCMIAWTLLNPYSHEGIDVQNHLLFSLEFNNGITDIWSSDQSGWGKRINQTIELFQATNIYWPRLANLLSVPFVQIFGRSIFAIKLSNLLYLFVLLLSTYGIAKELRDERTGFWACVLVSFSPIIYQSLRQYGLDLPLTAFVVLAVYLLIRSRGLLQLRETVLLGLVIGIGMLFKGQIVIFLCWPIALVVGHNAWQQWKKDRSSHVPRLGFDTRFSLYSGRFLLLLFIPAFIASIHWIPHLVNLQSALIEHISSDVKAGTGAEIVEIRSMRAYAWHFVHLFSQSAGPVIAFTWILSIVGLFKQFKRSEAARILLAVTIPPLLFFSFVFVTKIARFLMPIVPFMAISAAWFLWNNHGNLKRRLGRMVVLAYCLVTFFILSVGNFGGIEIHKQHELYSGKKFPLSSLLPITEYWDSTLSNNRLLNQKKLYDEVADAIVQDKEPGPKCKIGIIHMTRRLDFYTLPLFIQLKQKSIQTFGFIERTHSFYVHSSQLQYLLFIYDVGYSKPWVSASDLREAYKRMDLVEETISNVLASKAVPKLVSMEEQFARIKQFSSDNTDTEIIVYKRLD